MKNPDWTPDLRSRSDRRKYNLTESRIRWAMSQTNSNREAAIFLQVNERTYKKYASAIIDIESGKTLYELHLHRGVHREYKAVDYEKVHTKYDLRDIMEGKIDNPYGRRKYQDLLQKRKLIPERCSECGFNERRVTDQKSPLYLDFINGNLSDGRAENIRLLCHNCYFLFVGNTHGREQKYYKLAHTPGQIEFY